MAEPTLILPCPSTDDLAGIARRILSLAGDRRIITLTGDLGAGKTTFVAAALRELGSEDTVSSPTFALVQDYLLAGRGGGIVVHHIDAYRLDSLEEALDIGLAELFEDGSLTFVEWPAILAPILPEKRLDIQIRIRPDSVREFVIL